MNHVGDLLNKYKCYVVIDSSIIVLLVIFYFVYVFNLCMCMYTYRYVCMCILCCTRLVISYGRCWFYCMGVCYNSMYYFLHIVHVFWG